MAPIEQCRLVGPDGGRTLKISAYYGPYQQSPRDPQGNPFLYLGPRGNEDGSAWTTASCPTGEALFTVEALSSADHDRAAVRKALSTFAAESAKRHGCATPAEPVSDDDRTWRG
ncbi:hypothetical protein [Streptomyces sp. NBC_00212]|uniref:hypothetical protein n=1 Tax=Streptomyces sp. NBC_00212 TaxID=2975684 RepID=UPI0032533A3F